MCHFDSLVNLLPTRSVAYCAITHRCIAARGGLSHDHRQHATKIWWSLGMWFLKYVGGQTDKQTDRHTNTHACSSHCSTLLPERIIQDQNQLTCGEWRCYSNPQLAPSSESQCTPSLEQEMGIDAISLKVWVRFGESWSLGPVRFSESR